MENNGKSDKKTDVLVNFTAEYCRIHQAKGLVKRQLRRELKRTISEVLLSDIPLKIVNENGTEREAKINAFAVGFIEFAKQWMKGNRHTWEHMFKLLNADGLLSQLLTEDDIQEIKGETVQPTIDRIASYLDFSFYSQKRLIFVYGTTRSGKTFTIVQWLLKMLNDGKITGQNLIAGMTIPFLRNGAVNYITQLVRNYPNLTSKNNGFEIINNSTGGKLLSQSFEDKDKALSAQWNCVFLNECNTLGQDVVDALTIRSNGLILTDFNPSVSQWWGMEKMNSDNTLFCSFKDNLFLNETQKANIEEIRIRGEHAPVGSYAYWYYQVYYLGNFNTLGGGVFTNILDKTGEEFPADDVLKEIYAIDFGDTKDPNALVRIKWDSEKMLIHVKCELYKTQVSDVELVETLKNLNVQTLVFETATGGNTRAQNWRALGLPRDVVVKPCEKTTVQQGIFSLSRNQIVCYDKHSLTEFSGYVLKDGKFSGADHCIDATRYGYHLLEVGAIKS